MPRGDRTGPAGMGPMTGRAAGYCAGYPVPGYMNPIPGRGMGMASYYGMPATGYNPLPYGGVPYAPAGYGVMPRFGRGRGRGRGFGRGRGRGFGRGARYW